MPRKPRKTLKAKRQLTPVEIAYLSDDDTGVEHGKFTLFCYRLGDIGFDNDVHPRELWEENKDEFLPAFIEKNPGTRPYAWWFWSTSDGVKEKMTYTEKDKAIRRAQIRAVWPIEKQMRYLERHNLLTKEEAKSLKNGPKYGDQRP